MKGIFNVSKYKAIEKSKNWIYKKKWSGREKKF